MWLWFILNKPCESFQTHSSLHLVINPNWKFEILQYFDNSGTIRSHCKWMISIDSEHWIGRIRLSKNALIIDVIICECGFQFKKLDMFLLMCEIPAEIRGNGWHQRVVLVQSIFHDESNSIFSWPLLPFNLVWRLRGHRIPWTRSLQASLAPPLCGRAFQIPTVIYNLARTVSRDHSSMSS